VDVQGFWGLMLAAIKAADSVSPLNVEPAVTTLASE
jgi:hypothetical protein